MSPDQELNMKKVAYIIEDLPASISFHYPRSSVFSKRSCISHSVLIHLMYL